MSDSILVVVHPGSLLGSLKKEEENLYGNYKEYLDKVKNAINQQRSIVIISPLKDSFLKRILRRYKILPFKIPQETIMIKDFIDFGFNLGGRETLLSILKSEKINNVKICGEQLWWYSDIRKLNRLYLGCVVSYHNFLYKAGISSNIKRDLCYPSKDPLNFRGSF